MKQSKEKLEKIIKKNMKWFVLAICTVIIIEIVEDLLENEIHIFDNSIYYCIAKIISEPTTSFAKMITQMGSAYVIVPLCAILTILFWNKKWGKYITINLIISFISNQLLKQVVARPRPEGFRLIEESGYSFPSGHSMVSLAFYGFLIYLIAKKVKNPYGRWSLIISISILIVCIGLSRIYLGVHYASDVVAGFCISISYLILFTNLIKNAVTEGINDKDYLEEGEEK